MPYSEAYTNIQSSIILRNPLSSVQAVAPAEGRDAIDEIPDAAGKSIGPGRIGIEEVGRMDGSLDVGRVFAK